MDEQGNISVDDLPAAPDASVSIRDAFQVDTDATTPAFSQRTPHVPTIDPGYRFDPATTMTILSGFADNRRVVIQGRHGTGKSTHIEQVAARLNWP
jgi:cobaltochelatase CobS